MQEKLFESEAKVMEIIWAKAPISAKDISLIAAETIGWNKNTTYTVIKKLEAKGFIKREDPGFICKANLLYADGHVGSSSYNELRAIPKPADCYIANSAGADRSGPDANWMGVGYNTRAGAPQGF